MNDEYPLSTPEPATRDHGVIAVDRRTFVVGAAGSLLLTEQAKADASEQVKAATAWASLDVNGTKRVVSIEPRATLADVLRLDLALTGTKKACDRGECGACTVLVDGRRVLACMSLAIMQDGRAITTVEGLGTTDRPHPVQSAFVAHDGMQCGYCTPGQVMSATALIDEARQGWPSATTRDVGATFSIAGLDRTEVQERMSGNLCRCACYPNIVDAVLQAAGKTA